MPGEMNASIEIAPPDAIFIRSIPLVLNDKFPVFADKPVVVLPVNTNEGKAVVPAGSCKVPVMVSPVFRTLAEAAPERFAIIVPALKLPDASRSTIVFGVLRLVAVVAEFDTFPAVEIVASLVSTIPAAGSTSAFTIKELDKFPNASLCTIPALVNASIEIVPPEDIFNRSNPLVLNERLPVLADKPVVVLPVNINEGKAVVPAGNCKAPVIISPDLSTLLEALPVRFAVTVPAEKLPDASRATMVLAVLSGVASTLKVISSVLVIMLR